MLNEAIKNLIGDESSGIEDFEALKERRNGIVDEDIKLAGKVIGQ